MSKFDNKRKNQFVAQVPVASLDLDADRITERCKFNFSYFYVQQAGQAFGDWSHLEQTMLLEKLKAFSESSLRYWETQLVNGRPILSVYSAFPANSEFERPLHVPHQVRWGRFRLEQKVRLVGFVLPSEYGDKIHPSTKLRWDCNTFYVVFLDKNHVFYRTEKP